MREFTYEPQPTVGEDGKKVPSLFKGKVVLKVPKYKERLQLIKDLNFQVDDTGEIKLSDAQFDSAIKLVEVAEKHVVSVAVEKKGGLKYESLEDLEYDQDGAALINEVANVVLSGVQMGKT